MSDIRTICFFKNFDICSVLFFIATTRECEFMVGKRGKRSNSY